MRMTPGTGGNVPSASPNLSRSSEHAASAAFRDWMKSQLMFEVNTGSSEPAASAAPKLDEVPTNVRSEHQLEVSSRQVLHPSWTKSQLLFEVNIAQVSVQSLCTASWMKSQLCSK